MQDEILDAMRERIKSPILGTFSVCMIVASWKVYIIAFSGGNADEKINDIEIFLNDWFWTNVTGSIVATAFILFVIPIAKNFYEDLLDHWSYNARVKRIHRESLLEIERHGLTESIIHMKANLSSLQRVNGALMKFFSDSRSLASSSFDLSLKTEQYGRLIGDLESDLKKRLTNHIEALEMLEKRAGPYLKERTKE